MDLEKAVEIDNKLSKSLIKFFMLLVVCSILGKIAGDISVEMWKEFKTNLIAHEVADSIRGLQLVVDPRGMQKKQIAEMNKEQLMMANYLLRLELEKFHTQMSSIREMSDTVPMF